MKHKTWFRLVLQAVGVLLVGFGAPDLIADIGGYIVWQYQIAGTVRGGAMGPVPDWLGFLVQFLPPALQTAFGIYLMTGASWLLNKIIPSNRPYCPECGYELAHHSSPKCPECGVALPDRAEAGAGSAT